MAQTKKDLAIIGTGKFGAAVVEELVKMNRFVLAIDKDEEKLASVARLTKSVIADGTDIEALKDIGISKFGTVIVGAAENNIEIVSALIELGVKHIIAKARSARHERVLSQIGVDVIVRPESEAGIRTALIATNPEFIKNSATLQEIGDGYAIGSTAVTNEVWLNKPIKTLSFDGVRIVSVKRNSKVNLPNGDFKLLKGDIITIIGKIQKISLTFNQLNDNSGKTEMIKIKRKITAIAKKKPTKKTSKK